MFFLTFHVWLRLTTTIKPTWWWWWPTPYGMLIWKLLCGFNSSDESVIIANTSDVERS